MTTSQSPPALRTIGISLYAGDRGALSPGGGEGEDEGRTTPRDEPADADSTSTASMTEASIPPSRAPDTVTAAPRRRAASRRGTRPTDNAEAASTGRKIAGNKVMVTPIRKARPKEAERVAGTLSDSGGQTVAEGRGSDGSGAGQASTPGAGGGTVGLAATCLACPRPTYPRQARRRGWQGVVDLRLLLDAVGRVADVGVARSSGFKVLDDAAVAAARRSRFRLRLDAGHAGAWGRMRYRFEIDGG